MLEPSMGRPKPPSRTHRPNGSNSLSQGRDHVSQKISKSAVELTRAGTPNEVVVESRAALLHAAATPVSNHRPQHAGPGHAGTTAGGRLTVLRIAL